MGRILVLGSGGMAGHVMAHQLLLRGHDLVAAARGPLPPPLDACHIPLDVECEESVSSICTKRSFDAVVNCVGVLVEASEIDPERSIRLNALLPRTLARLGHANGFKLIHISTDCVFSGSRGGYCERDSRDGTGTYARTKALGEVDETGHLSIRTSIIGPELKDEGSGLFSWFMRQDGPIQGFTNHLWSGVTTLELARAVAWVLDHPIDGLINLTNSKAISKYELLEKLNALWRGSRVHIEPVETAKGNDKSLVSLRSIPGLSVPSYDEMLSLLHDHMKAGIFRYPYA